MARIELVFPNFTFSRMNRNDYENVDLLEPKCRKIHYISSFFVRPPATTTSRVIVVRGRVLVRNGRKKVQKLFKLFKII